MQPTIPRPHVSRYAVALCCALGTLPAAASVVWNKVYTGFPQPVEITQAHDGSQRLFVVQQSGAIRIIKNGAVLPTPFIDLGGASGVTAANGEQGLLGLAFHPQYASNRQFYVNYTRKSDGATVIARYSASAGNPDVADPLSATILLTIAQPEANHNGGAVVFGPDGYLYIGMGDGGGANDQHGTIGNGQDKTTLLGKILRIDVDGANPYAIPPGNPFASGVGGRQEIFAIGVRNPWRMSFDRATGDFWIGDVGQGAVEEVDYLPVGTGAGVNFGWRIMEGNSCTGNGGPVPCNDPSLTPPVLTYTHSFGCSITGGYVYRGAAVPLLAGQYVYGDFCTGRIWAAQRVGTGPWVPAELGVTGYAITTFGEDEAGELYFANYNTGDIYRFADSGASSPVLAASAASLAFGNVTLGNASATQTFNVTNTGAGTLTLATLTQGGVNPADFVRTGTCASGKMLTASQSCTVTYQFTPAAIGARSASLAIASNGGNAVVALTGTGVVPTSGVADVIEFYHAALDHYFISSLAADIDALDSGRFQGWTRTGRKFKAYSAMQAGTSAVCRFYIPPAAGDSHFFSASPIECAEVLAKFPAFTYESPAVMYEFLPDLASGACPQSTVPVYRVWNRRADSNHRYTTDRVLRDAMVAQGYVAEGYGPDAVVMCAPQ